MGSTLIQEDRTMLFTSPLRRWLAPAGVASVALGVAACGGNPSNKTSGAGNSSGWATAPKVEIGARLYEAVPVAAGSARVPVGPEPIVIQQATIQFDEKISLAAQVDGEIELIATPLDPNAKYDPKDPRYASRLVPRRRDKNWMHVRLLENDLIREGQILAFLDDSQVALQLQTLKSALAEAKAAALEGEVSVRSTSEALNLTRQAGSSKIETIKYEVDLSSAKTQQARTKVELVRYEGERSITEDKQSRHYLFSPFSGKVLKILKSPGEFVKAGEPILEIQNISRFRVEGKIDRQDAEKIRQYTPVLVETVRSYGPEPYTARHRQDVTGLVVTAHTGRPMIVSASNDGTALVWEVTATEKKQHILPHQGAGVRCIAATGAKAGTHLVATGTADGKVRLWDLSNPAQLPDKPMAEFEESHAQAVTAIAFSPDGRYLVTAAGRDVFLWDVSTRKKKYALPTDHKDDVKAMHFTPQATLVTISRDKSARVWAVGTDGASIDTTFDHRSGTVDVLGVSSDGNRLLFDQEATRLDVVNLSDRRTVGSLMNTGGGIRFSGLALFSGDDKFIITGAGDADSKGELQLWATPENGRGSERRRLVTQFRASVTCAAFSPPDSPVKFVAVGTQTGAIHFWLLPEVTERSALKGRVASVLANDARSAQVRVEVENGDGALTDLIQDRGSATIIIDPTAKPVPPELPVPPIKPPTVASTPNVRPSQAVPMNNTIIPAGGVIR
jgi:WD40 repeat protein